MPPNYLKLFGTPELRTGSGTVAFRTRKQLALLVYLALEANDRGVSRDLLVELFWPEMSIGRGRHSLSQGLSAIRQALGRDTCTRARAEVRLTCKITTQLDQLEIEGLPEFDQPLKGLDACAGAEFAHWVDATRQRCLVVARKALRDSLEAARSTGNAHRVHERAAMLYRVDPLSDEAALALAERALLDGDRAGAIRLLRGHVVQTERQLGCDAGSEITRRLRRIEGGGDVQRSEPPQLGLSLGGEPPAFIGRGAEVASLEALWSGIAERGLVTCLVTGSAGIGKSTLVRRFADSVESRGWPVFSLTCQEIGRSIPFATVSDLIYAICRDSAVGGSDPIWLSEVSRVTPGIKSAYPGIPNPPTVPAESVRVRVAESITRVLEGLADGSPMLLVFDDVQHMDPASRDVLHVLLRRMRSAPMLLLGALRTIESGRFDFAIEPGPADFTWNRAIHLRPLNAADAEALIAAKTKDPMSLDVPVRSKIVELAEGNPYLIEMLLSDWQHDRSYSLVAAEVTGDATCARWHPPDTMRRAFARQYEGLSPVAQRTLAVLAVAGKKMTAGEIAALAAVDPTRTAHAAFELADRGIVRPEGKGLAFKNEMHRAFVYFACLGEESRTYHHAQLAEWIKAGADDADFQRALEITHHLLRSDLVEEAVTEALRGGRLAIGQGAPSEAEQMLTEVVSNAKTNVEASLYLLLAQSQVAQGKYRAVLETVGKLKGGTLDQIAVATRDVLRAEALHRGQLADDQSISVAMRRAVTTATDAEAETLLLNALQMTAEVATDTSDLATIEQVIERAQDISLGNADGGTKGLAQITLGYCRMVLGKYEQATKDLLDAKAIMHRLQRDLDLRMVLHGLGICYSNLGRYKEAELSFHSARLIAARLGHKFSESASWDNLAVLYEDLGWFNRAATAYRRAFELCNVSPTPRRLIKVLTNAAGLAVTLGNLPEADRLLHRAESTARDTGVVSRSIEVLLGRADYFLAMDQPEVAWTNVKHALTLSKGKTPLDGLVGHFGRLIRHYTWATQGFDRMLGFCDASSPPMGIGNSRARQLEAQAFVESVDTRHPYHGRPSVIDEIIAESLYGVLARLSALRLWRGSDSDRRPGESGAALIARLYPDPRRTVVPGFVLEGRLTSR